MGSVYWGSLSGWWWLSLRVVSDIYSDIYPSGSPPSRSPWASCVSQQKVVSPGDLYPVLF